MLKTPITGKAATLVDQHQREVSELRQQCQLATKDVSRHRFFLLSQPSLPIWSFAVGAYVGARRKKVKVVTPQATTANASFPLFSLLNTGLSLLALKYKASSLFAKDTSVQPAPVDTRNPEL